MEEKELLKLIRESDATDLAVLIQAKEAAKRNLLEEATSANIAAYERAAKALKEMHPGQAESEPVFKHRMEALVFLQKEGYCTARGIVQKSKLYKDARDGLLKMQPDGSITEKDLNRYIRLARLVKHEKKVVKTAVEELYQNEKKLEIERKEEQIKDLRFNRAVKQGRYLPIDDHYLELAARAVSLEAHLRFSFEMDRAALLDDILAAADRGLQEEIIEERFNNTLNRALTEYADITNYHVIFIDDAATK